MAARDLIVISIILFAIGIGFFVINYASNTVIDSMVGIAAINQSSATVAALQGVQDKAINRMDYLFLGLFVGLVLGLIITGWFIGTNPVFVFIYILVMVLSVVFSTVLASVWQNISQNITLTSSLTNFPITNHILGYLPMYMAIIGFIGVVVMFAKPYITGEAQ